MDSMTFIQWALLIVTAGSFVIAAMALNHKFNQDDAKDRKQAIAEYEAHAARMKEMETNIAKLQKETEELRVERGKIVSEIYAEIKGLKSKHDQDIEVMHREIKELVAEIKTKNESDHNELKSILKVINDQLITVCTQVQERTETSATIKPRRK
jgi:flagellar basal body-associated protein FliL